MPERPGRAGLPRRRVLRALAVAPAALAGCAAGRAAGAAAPVAPAPKAAGTAPGALPPSMITPASAVAAVRGFRLPADAEPAFVFRAAATRPGEPR